MKMKLPGVLLVCIALSACFLIKENDDDDAEKRANFVSEACGGCKAEEYIFQGSTVIGIRFFSYVKNAGDAGRISMTIGAGAGDTSKEFDVTAGTSYVFQASVPVTVSSSSSFSYQARFPGTQGYTDTHPVSGYHCTGAPYDLQLNPR